jgi:hypothetical protein
MDRIDITMHCTKTAKGVEWNPIHCPQPGEVDWRRAFLNTVDASA